MKREMYILDGHVQRFHISTDTGKMCERRVGPDEFLNRRSAQEFLDEHRDELDLRGWTAVWPHSRPAKTPGEEFEAKAWQRLQQTELPPQP